MYWLTISTVDSAAINSGFSLTRAGFAYNNWTWIAIVELFLLLFLIYKLIRVNVTEVIPTDEDLKKIKEARKLKTDMGAMMQNIHHSKALYDQLKKKVHPDRFVGDDEKVKAADVLFQSIQEHQHNFKELEKLRDDAIEILGIKFN